MPLDYLPALWLTVKLALVTSVLLLIIATPLAWWLTRWQCGFKPIVQAIIALPLVLPPTVLGFYLLIAFSPDSPLGAFWLNTFGSTLAFSFEGLVLGSLLYSLPFAVQPLYGGFSQLDNRYLTVAKSLHLTPLAIATKLVLPLCKSSFAVAFGLSFAHTLGEFGVVLMIGGNIPHETQVVSIALYEQVESLNYTGAHTLSLVLLAFSLLLMVVLYWFNGKGGLGWNSQSR
ncbi:molybdate ABC transporter permease subunit [Alteromonas sp. KUL49]|uniref:molybdate ABC transporter permease subunit n=1 Tax=Alteromonas sp. KUL49 TaxID=2480798 RepID=UPI00102F26CF|nr:molybdate ABC transporter permease subunit [Alteromonas sp. KUL49]TAP37350.1 molybdate ABC transporter permease subunit [Alteromonas sp. KUL49]GEA12980.1 molybdate ABC transporter permease [Alteromonas sp. KUL49]